MELTIALSLDLKGLSCPLPIARTARAMKDLAPGSVIEVFATDPGSIPDFKAWAKSTGNTLLEQTAETDVYRFLLEKKEA